jgi:hypothetical protein
MCLLIHQPRGVTFSKAEVADFIRHNPDGFGVAYGDGSRLHLLRLVGSPSEIQDAYTRHAAGRECVIHFRMTTHGATNADNAHPYPITPDIAVAHNGVLSIGNPHDKGMSDTWHLVEFFLRPIATTHPDLLFDPVWGDMLGRLIGSSNKLAISHADGRVAIINKASGVMHKRAWLSNTYAWSAPHAATPRHTAGGSRASAYRWDDDAPAWWADDRASRVSYIRDISDDDTSADIPADDDLSDLWADAEEAYLRDRDMGVSLWAHNNPQDAAALLCHVFGVEYAEAAEWLEDHAADAVTALAEAIAEEVGVSS